jgi:hypothetical protein
MPKQSRRGEITNTRIEYNRSSEDDSGIATINGSKVSVTQVETTNTGIVGSIM